MIHNRPLNSDRNESINIISSNESVLQYWIKNTTVII